MPSSPPRPCSRCGAKAGRGGLCQRHRRDAERRRGSATARGYGTEHEKRFRAPVLARDPMCVICARSPSVHADHYPLSRRELVRLGADPNDPKHGRGLCASCHSRHTITTGK